MYGPIGIHAQEDPSGDWRWAVQDALGSVRGEVDAALDMQGSRGFSPYGEVFGAQGAFASPYAFTGEPLDANGLVHLRARYYAPGMGRFVSMDPSWQEANPYEYGVSNPINHADPSGLQGSPQFVILMIWHVSSNYYSVSSKWLRLQQIL